MSNGVKHPVKGYYGVTVVSEDEFRGYKGVEFNIFKRDAKEAALKWIARNTDSTPEYGADDVYWLSQFDMMFTLPEVGQLIEWFVQHMTHCHVRVYPAVAYNNNMSVGCMAVGGNDDFLCFDEADDYTLPFKVWGYFNMRRYLDSMSVDDWTRTFDQSPVGVAATADDEIPF